MKRAALLATLALAGCGLFKAAKQQERMMRDLADVTAESKKVVTEYGLPIVAGLLVLVAAAVREALRRKRDRDASG